MIIGLNTIGSNDASGHRTHAIWEYLEKQKPCLLYIIESDAQIKKETRIILSKFGRFYNFFKKYTLLRVIFEVLLALEFIILHRKKIALSDWFWISSPPYFFSLTVLLYLNFLKKEVIFDVKDIYPEVFYMTKIIKPTNRFYLRLKAFTHRHLEKVNIVCATHGIANYYKKIFPQKNIYTLLNGSNIVAQNKNKDFNKKFAVIFHGRLGKLQNINLLKELIFELPEINFVVLSKDNIFSDGATPFNLRFSKTLSGAHLIEEIQKAHIGISLRDNSDLTKISNAVKIFDYIACGTPVVSSPPTEIDSIVTELSILKSFDFNAKDAIKNFLTEISSDQSKYFEHFPSAGKASTKFLRCHTVNNFMKENMGELL